MFKEINSIKVIIMDKRKIRYFGGWIINILSLILILYFQNFATAQLDYSVDLSEKARIKSEDKDFLQQRQIEAEKKQIKKKMKELLGDRDYKQLLGACERLQKLDPDDKFIDLYLKYYYKLLKMQSKTKTPFKIDHKKDKTGKNICPGIYVTDLDIRFKKEIKEGIFDKKLEKK